MSRIHLMIAVLLGALLSIVIFISSEAQETVVTTMVPSTQNLIVTPAPAPKEAVVIPQGYSNCFTVAAGWYNNTWVPEHKVCQYTTTTTTDATTAYEGTTWIEGYWACNVYKNQECTNWEWKPGRWVKTLEVY